MTSYDVLQITLQPEQAYQKRQRVRHRTYDVRHRKRFNWFYILSNAVSALHWTDNKNAFYGTRYLFHCCSLYCLSVLMF